MSDAGADPGHREQPPAEGWPTLSPSSQPRAAGPGSTEGGDAIGEGSASSVGLGGGIRLSPSGLRSASSQGPFRHYASMLAATMPLLESELMGTELGLSTSTTLFVWHMLALVQEALRGVINSANGLVHVPSAMGKSVVRYAAGKRLRTSKANPDLILRVYG